MPGKIIDKLSTVLSIPQEVVSDVPRMIFDSNTRVYIENYRGINEYTGESIKVNAGRYVISVIGEGLEIKKLTTEETVIEGIIKAVEFC